MGEEKERCLPLVADIPENLKKEFMDAAKNRCMTATSVITLFVRKFVQQPRETVNFLFDLRD